LPSKNWQTSSKSWPRHFPIWLKINQSTYTIKALSNLPSHKPYAKIRQLATGVSGYFTEEAIAP
jgi:hypothetical protein